ncbi:MAG: NusG domain II-containing protein [Gammaproteobacteria bacterium]|nr:NusG domain II-containing protein [Gammaproteobacteria bacterium]
MTRADYLVLAGALLLLPWLYASFWHRGGAGEEVRIVGIGGEETIASLREDRELRVQGPLGTSVIEIRDGKARFVSSPCHGQHCVHAGWLHLGGEFTACLPNRISLAVIGRELRYDTINF